ncbi:MAG: DUF5916 domain-containing protein [bacterium]
MPTHRLCLAALSSFVVASSSHVHAQSRPAPPAAVSGNAAAVLEKTLVIRATRAVVRPVIDGRIDEPIWATASAATAFVQRAPEAGRPASQRTEARQLVDGDALYIAMRLEDTAPDSIVTAMMRRDGDGNSDWAHVFIDSYNDKRTAFHFAVNPSGVKRDGFISGNSEWNEDIGWDAVWDVATHRDSTGWTAEFRIPLSQLRFAAGAGAGGATWGIELGRDIARRGERSYWAPIPPNAGTYVSNFGSLVGVPVQEAKRRVEINPYVLARSWRSNAYAGNSLLPGSMQNASTGADFKVGVGSNLTLTGTVNPDFGQVEADPAQVNLTGAETILPEKRTFFTEGSDLFHYNLSWGGVDFGNEQLVYTRRIGRMPQLALPDVASHSVATDPTRLLGAAKLSGRIGQWRLGVLSATTEEETGLYAQPSGIGKQVTEPLTHYGVARLDRDFENGASQLGVIVTATNRRLDSLSSNTLRSAAYAAGVEGEKRFGGGRYLVSGNVFGSLVDGSASAIARTQTSFQHLFQRDPNALGLDSSATSMSGLAAELRLSKQSGGLWRVGATAHVVTRGFEVNDLGYISRTNLADVVGWLGRIRNEQTAHTRSWASFLNVRALSSLVGPERIAGANWWNRVQFQNYWELSGMLDRSLGGTSSSLLRGGPAMRTPARTYAEYELRTDPRRPLSWVIDANGSPKDADGSSLVSVSPGLIYRPLDRAEFQLRPAMEWRRTSTQFIDYAIVSGARHDLVGDLQQQTASLTGRASYAFTPDLTLQLYAQPFVSRGRYLRVGEVANAQASRHEDRVHFFGARDISVGGDREHVTYQTSGGAVRVGNPEFDTRTLNANAVVRWEYRPGSTLFVVWSQGRDEDARLGTDAFRELTRQVWSAPATNVFLVKWAYYLGR